jgi:hypothetical protein
MSRARPPVREKKPASQTVGRHLSRPGIINTASIPIRDEDDAYGNPFLGLPANRMKYRDLGNDELGTNAVDGRTAAPQFLDVTHFPILDGTRRLPSGVGFALGDALGELDNARLPNILKSKIPSDIVYGDGGKVDRGQIRDFLNGDRLIKDGTLPLTVLAGRPWASKTEPAQVRRIARKIARDVVNDMVKAASLK